MTDSRDVKPEKATALLSDDRLYRYYLLRRWDYTLPTIAFIGLNPSTADETVDDPTIRKCRKFAKAWGFGALLMLNLFAWRTAYPNELWKAKKQGKDVIGIDGNRLVDLLRYMREFQVTKRIAAWGTGKVNYRGVEAMAAIKNLDCLKENGDGSPAHPLYLRDDSQPLPWNY